MTPSTGRGRRLTIYVGESDHAKGTHRPLFSEIIERAEAAGLAGASAFRGWEGFGSSSHIHTARLLSLSEDLPLVIVIVDTPERIEAFLPQLEDLIADGTVEVADVDLIHFGATTEGPAPTSLGGGSEPGVDAAHGGDRS